MKQKQAPAIVIAVILLSVCVIFIIQYFAPDFVPKPHTYEILKCSFHTHTTYSDGHYTPTEVVNIYNDLDYDVLAITDHNTIVGYAEAKVEGNKLGLSVICGEEVSYSWADGSDKHVVALFTNQKIGGWGDKEVPIIFDEIHEQNGIGIVAHACRTPENWEAYKSASYIDGWEVGPPSMEWVYESEYIYLRNHDFHFHEDPPDKNRLPTYWTYLLVLNRTEAGVRDALTSRRIVVYDDGELYGSSYALNLYAQNQDNKVFP